MRNTKSLFASTRKLLRNNKQGSAIFTVQQTARDACFYSTQTLPKQAQAIRFHKFGQAKDVLQMDTIDVPALGPNQVLVKMLAAPINPADVNVIEGVYAMLPALPATAGNEGVGVVEQVGSQVTSLQVGQRVLPTNFGFGTMRTFAVCNQEDLLPVSSKIPVEYAATLDVNPCTAYRMLQDFVNLKSGDVIVQNGANSMVGTAVIQLAKARGIKTINLIRDRPAVEDTVEQLKKLGGDIVVTTDYANSAAMKRLVSDLPKPKLALNCVGGKAARVSANLLGEQGVMVTYGGMSREPVTTPTGQFIFKDITLKGFWLSRWRKTHSIQEKQAMIDELSELVQSQRLVLFTHTFKFAEFKRAFEAALAPSTGERRKIVLKME